MKSLLPVLILALFYASTNAQETNGRHYSSWNTLSLMANIHSQSRVDSEFSLRRTNFLSDWEQIIIRPSLHYEMKDNIQVGLGYSYIKNFSYSEYSTPLDASENNIWQQLVIEQPLPRLSLIHRFRFEERFIESVAQNTNGDFIKNGINRRNRLRYRFVVSIPLKIFENRTKLRLITYDEAFLNFGNGLRPKKFDQNWIYFGIDYRANEKWSIRSGYHDIYAKAENDLSISNHIWETTLTFRII